MARTALQKIYADFRQGFVTVANPLAFPEGSVKDIVNFDIQDNGTLRVRPGLRYETDTKIPTGLTLPAINEQAVSVHYWNNVDNDGNHNIVAVQVGTTLYMYSALEDGIDLDNPLGTIALGIPSEGLDVEISTTSGSGRLFVAHPNIKPKVISYPDSFGGAGLGSVSGGFVVEDIDIKIRDLSVWEGITEQQTGKVSGSTLYPQHEYNLRNAGWPTSAHCSASENPNDSTVTADPVRYTRTKVSIYPAISIPFYAGRAGGGSSTREQIAYSPWAVDNNYFGNTVIPLGRNIVNAEEWSREGRGDTELVPLFSTGKEFTKTYSWLTYPSSIEFYSGRVWYTGAKGYQETQSLSTLFYNKKDNLDTANVIYFSQQLGADDSKVNKCYQENDPTAEDINQLLATDGGTLTIRGAGDIYDLKVFGTSLIVFASEGVWSVSGIDGNSFKADGFSVNKISNVGPSSKKTVASNSRNLYYIANDAVYVLTTDELTGNPTPQDITSGRIKDFYTEIPYRNKQNAKAFFDPSNRIFYMFYTDAEGISDNVRNIYYNKCIVFNQDLGCFYKYDVAIQDNYIVDGFHFRKDQVVNISEPITLDGVVVDIAGEAVTLDSSYSTASLNNIQLLTLVDTGANAEFTFSSFTDITTFEDWGNTYNGYVEFGFDAAGDIMRDSTKAPVLISHMERTEDGFEVNPADPDAQELILTNQSGCLLSYGWDWATNYKNPMQLYRFNRNYIPSGSSDTFDYGVDVITTRNRIRGKGNSLGVRLDTEAGKDCRVLGIGILYTMAQRV